MMTATEYITYEANIAIAECDYELAKLNADYLGISIDEYYDFVADMDGMVEDTLTAEELEQMYAEYCAEYDIPYALANYDCYDIQGW
jgi:hypothetical protein